MSTKQLEMAVEIYRTMLMEHGRNFSSTAVQAVLDEPEFAAAQFTLFRERVEARSGLIVRDFAVDLKLVGMNAIRATGRPFYGNEAEVSTMPRATVERGKIHFFKLKESVPEDLFAGEHDKRGLKPVDPHTLAAFNTANPEFADTHPNYTQWADAEGKFCYADFDRLSGERGVRVDRRGRGRSDEWWLAGVSE